MSNAHSNVISFSSVPAISTLQVAPFEADQIEVTNRARLTLAKAANETLAAMRPRINRLDHSIAEYSGMLRRCREEFRARGEDVYHMPFSPRLYKWMIVIASFLESPLNAAALDFLRLPEVESYMLAGFFAIVNVWGAKTSARIFRQSELKAWRDWLIFVLFNILFLLMIRQFGE